MTDFVISKGMVLKSAAGYYLGTLCWDNTDKARGPFIEPYSRDTDWYYDTKEEAEQALTRFYSEETGTETREEFYERTKKYESGDLTQKCNMCGTEDRHGHEFRCIGQMVDEPTKKARYAQERIYSQEECLEQAEKMKSISSAFYGMAQTCGHHQFIEFCGLMNKYIDMFRTAVKEGADPNSCNIHIGLPMPGVAEHDIKYLAEKFECIFGPTLQDRKLRRVFIEAMGWKDEF